MTLIIASFLTKLLMMAGIGNYVIQESKFIIIKSEMSESMKKHALGTAMVAFEEPGIPINSKKTDIAIKLSAEFDDQYGKHWFCLVGPPGFVSHFDHIEGTLLWFSYKDIQVIMFKMAKQSQSDIIRESRRTDKMKVKLLRCEMSESMKAQAITTTIMAFHEYNTFEKIAANITDVFDQLHGQQWQCIIGYQGFNAKFNFIEGTYISFQFGDAQVALFQVMKQVEPHEVISRARLYIYHPVIDYNSLEKSVRNRLVRVAIENIYRYDNFVDIARGITSALLARDGVHWACVTGHMLYLGEDVPECHHQAISVNFGELRVLLCAYDIHSDISSNEIERS